jgi:glutamyl-tRNA reductase
MSLLVVGLSHRTAPTSLLEAAAIPVDDVTKLLDDLLGGEQVTEGAVLSTCNRVEVYAEVATFHGGVTEVSDLLSRACGVALDDLTSHLYVHHEARAVQHLFSVSCGLDSMLVGEAQILGQVRATFRTAETAGSLGRGLGDLFRAALRVGKRVHSETGIDGAGASLVSVAVRLADEALGGLAGRPALLVGAGSTGALAGATLRRAGIGALTVANRTRERGVRLARTLEGGAIGLSSLSTAIAEADLVVSSTGATGTVVTYDDVAQAMAARGGRPLVVIDLALPRDVDPQVKRLPGVTVIDLDTLRGVLDVTPSAGDPSGTTVGAAVEAARALVAEEVGTYLDHQRALRVAPTVVALRARAADVVRTELARLQSRMPDLDPSAAAEVEGAMRRVVEKLLHTPTVRVQQLAEAPGGHTYAEALQELFGLDRETPAAVSTADPRAVP